MMLDDDVVAVSPSSVYRVLKQASLLARQNVSSLKTGTEFVQPIAPHELWHADISYLNICGTFYYLCSLLDGCSWYLVHWEIRESMTEADVETIVQRAREKFPGAQPRIISDNGPQFIAKDFKEFIRLAGLTHVRTSPKFSRAGYYAWLSETQSLQEQRDRELMPLVCNIFWQHKRRYDARRIAFELNVRGQAYGVERVAKLLKLQGLQAIQPQSFKPKTTNSRHTLGYNPNLRMRMSPPALLNRIWIADITYLPLKGSGFAYLASVVDLCSRRVVGWTIDVQMTELLVPKRCIEHSLARSSGSTS